MAKKNSGSKGGVRDEGVDGSADAGSDDDFDSYSRGMEDVGMPDIDGWWKPEEGSKLYGQVVGRTQIENDDGKMRDVVVVKLERPTVAVMEGADVTLEPGQCIGVGIRAKLTELLMYVEKKGKIAVRADGKRKLKGGRTMWLFTVKGEKGKRAAPPAPITRNSAADGTSDVDF